MKHNFNHLKVGDKIVYEDDKDTCSGTVVRIISNDEVIIDFYNDKDGYHIGEVTYTSYALYANHCFSLINKCKPVNLEEII